MPVDTNNYKINPTAMSENDAKILGTYLVKNKRKFLEKNPATISKNKKFSVTHNLIIDNDHNVNSKHPRYFVIANSKALGAGTYSKTREIIGFIEIDSDTYETKFVPEEKRLVVRITNTKSAQQKRATIDPYSHKKTLKEYRIIKNFTHMGAHPPIKVKKYDQSLGNQLGFFYKSYSVANFLHGKSLHTVAAELDSLFYEENQEYPPLSLKIAYIISLLEAYHEQIASKGYVHRDINSYNIAVKFKRDNLTFSVWFLDLDSARRPGWRDSGYGSPGFLPPELEHKTDKQSPSPRTVTQQRDIFSLGVLAISAIHTALYPDYFFDPNDNFNAEEVSRAAISFVKEKKSYNPDQLIKMLNERCPPEERDPDAHFFEYTDLTGASSTELKDITALLRAMTSVDPKERPSIEDAISGFGAIQERLPVIKNFKQLFPQAIDKSHEEEENIPLKLL